MTDGHGLPHASGGPAADQRDPAEPAHRSTQALHADAALAPPPPNGGPRWRERAAPILRTTASMRPLRALVLLLSLVTMSGCSAAGYCIGASTPHYEHHTVSASSLRWSDEVHQGEEIGFRARRRGSREIGDDAAPWRNGIYEGIDDDTLAISTSDGPDRIPLVDIDEVRVRRGTEWVTGTLVGALVDAIIVGSIVATLKGNARVDIDVPSTTAAARR